MTQHTPGPWELEDNITCLTIWPADKEGEAIFDAISCGNPADGKLIVAAPELLDALEDCVTEIMACSAWEDALQGEDDALLKVVNTAEALIARIKGEAFTPYTAEGTDEEEAEA